MPVPQSSVCLRRDAKAACVTKLWAAPQLNSTTKDVLIYLGGYLTRRWQLMNNCEQCDPLLQSNTVSCSHLEHKDFRPNALVRPSEGVVQALKQLEDLFVASSDDILHLRGIVSELMSRARHVAFPFTEPCHPNMREFFFRNFFVIRVYHNCKLYTRTLKNHKLCQTKKAKRLNFVSQHVLKKNAHKRAI
jgi:hypothetical protein